MSMDAELREVVVARSNGRCEYCGMHQRFFSEFFQIEHIVALQHRGETVHANLAVACARCNRHKGPNISGIDPVHETMTRLFNPRIDIWEEHFSQDFRGSINGLTDIGRTTVYVLDMNAPRRVELRAAIRAIEDADRKT